MEAFSNSRWRESNHSSRVTPPFPLYHQSHQSPTRKEPLLPDHNGSRHWQRNGPPIGPIEPWGDHHGPHPSHVNEQCRQLPRPPLLSTPGSSENGYMQWVINRKETTNGGGLPRHESHDHRLDRGQRRHEVFRPDFTGHSPNPSLSCRLRFQRQHSHHPRDFHPPPRNHVHSEHTPLPLNDGSSPLSYSPAYSDPTSSPDTRSWDVHLSPSLERGDISPRDPRRRPHLSHHHTPDSSPHKRDSHYRQENATPPTSRSRSPPHAARSRDPRRHYKRPSQTVKPSSPSNDYHGKNRSLDNGYSRPPGFSTSGNSATNSSEDVEPVMKMKKVVDRISTEQERLSPPNQSQTADRFKVLKSVLISRIMMEHSYAKTDISAHSVKQRHSSDTNLDSCKTSLSVGESLSNSSDMLLSLTTTCENREPSQSLSCSQSDDILTDDTSSDGCPSPTSLVGFSLDLDIEPESSSSASSPKPQNPLMVSIPLSTLSKSSNTNAPRQHVQEKKLFLYAARKGSPSDASCISLVSADSDKESEDSLELTNVKMNGDNSKITPKRRSYRSRSKESDRQSTASSSSSRSLRKRPFQDFVPQVLKARSRAEAATMRRRRFMEEEMKKNESDRKSTALPGEEPLRSMSPTKCNSPSLDDSSSTISLSSYQDSIKEEFSPEFVLRCKRRYAAIPIGSGDSVLHKVCRTGRLKAARYYVLVEQHKVDIQDNAGWTPLHEACNNSYPDIVRVLLENGADPNLASFDGSRPIHDAIEAGDLSIVQLLVEFGADVMAEQGEKTPLELAKTHGQTEIISYLEGLIQERNKKKISTKESVLMVPKITKKVVPTLPSLTHFESHVKLPMDGYTEPMLGPELDSPLVFISAIVEHSEVPLLPLYNIQISSGPNPRKHNFHLLSDVLEFLSMSRETLLSQLNVKTHIISLANFLQQLLNNPLTRHAPIIAKIQDLTLTSEIELVPLCSSLRKLFNIELSNIDD